MQWLFLAAPELGHIFEGLAFGLGHEAPYEEGGDDADDAVEAVGEPMAEVVAGLQVHVEHRHEGGGDDEVEDPLEGYGNGHGSAADGVGEDLGDEHPADGAPREHEGGGIDHDAEHSDDLEASLAEGGGYAEGSECHAERAPDEERLAAPALYGEHGDEGEEDVDDAHDDGVDHGVGHAHIAEDAGGIVEHGVDAYGLLEDAEHDADEDAEVAVGEEALGAHGDGLLDVGEDLCCARAAIDALEDAEGAVVATYHDEVARRLGHEADEQGEEACGHSFGTEHIAPAGLDGPRVAAGGYGVDALAYGFDDGVGVVAEDEEVDEIDDELAEDDGELVPRDEHAADVGGRHLADVHGADGRGQTYAYAANDAVDVEGDEQREGGHAMGMDEELGRHGAESRDKEEDAGHDERALTAEARGQQARECRAYDAADERRRRGEAVHEIGVLEILGAEEEGLQTFFCARDDGGVVAEEEAAEDGHEDD